MKVGSSNKYEKTGLTNRGEVVVVKKIEMLGVACSPQRTSVAHVGLHAWKDQRNLLVSMT